MIDPRLDQKVVLITGANHGIGAATAKSLAAQGAMVFITYFVPDTDYAENELTQSSKAGVGGKMLSSFWHQQSGKIIADEIQSQGGTTASAEFDLSAAENINTLFNLCEDELGPVDVLINNHTHCVPETFDPAAVNDEISLTDVDSIDHHFAVNARACVLLMREYLQRFLDREATSGRIINLTTTLGHAKNISYAASKRALVSYSISAAEEMGPYGITVNVVCPGPTQTGYIPPASEKRLVKKTPLGRLGLPEDIADVITFLASEKSRWLTGQLIYASGGFSTYLSE